MAKQNTDRKREVIKLISTIILLLLSVKSFAQEAATFFDSIYITDIQQTSKLGLIRNYSNKDDGIKSKVWFIGHWEDSYNNSHKVFTSFNIYGNKGVSRVILCGNKRIICYHADMPDYLPVKIMNNKFLFNKGPAFELESTEYPFCTPYGCFEMSGSEYYN
ncbi:hypothetical protein FUAX_55000 (plasmid) [Fulvitalea axinellae]|uniref:Uncharacterized protein n=1 Tax=Fulvitalea axinellae TaxID=1182444 RepID=A0AAU9CYP1_9BACT|nr:hypothetical protein FUAX_55000 [Fulvitalea axinellae]